MLNSPGIHFSRKTNMSLHNVGEKSGQLSKCDSCIHNTSLGKCRKRNFKIAYHRHRSHKCCLKPSFSKVKVGYNECRPENSENVKHIIDKMKRRLEQNSESIDGEEKAQDSSQEPFSSLGTKELIRNYELSINGFAEHDKCNVGINAMKQNKCQKGADIENDTEKKPTLLDTHMRDLQAENKSLKEELGKCRNDYKEISKYCQKAGEVIELFHKQMHFASNDVNERHYSHQNVNYANIAVASCKSPIINQTPPFMEITKNVDCEATNHMNIYDDESTCFSKMSRLPSQVQQSNVAYHSLMHVLLQEEATKCDDAIGELKKEIDALELNILSLLRESEQVGKKVHFQRMEEDYSALQAQHFGFADQEDNWLHESSKNITAKLTSDLETCKNAIEMQYGIEKDCRNLRKVLTNKKKDVKILLKKKTELSNKLYCTKYVC